MRSDRYPTRATGLSQDITLACMTHRQPVKSQWAVPFCGVKGTSAHIRLLVASLLFTICSTLSIPAISKEDTPKDLVGVGIQEKLGTIVDTNLEFTDYTGKQVNLGDYFSDDKPVLLTLNYYRCAMLCNLQLKALAKGLKALSLYPGRDFHIVTISIDPRETPKLAKDKRWNLLKEVDRGKQAEWDLLVGKKDNIEKIANSVGFNYKYIEEEDQYAHPAAIYFLSAESKGSAKLVRYLYGLDYPAKTLKFALIDAAQGKVGSTIDKIILSCFHFDATKGKYGPTAFGIMRIGATLTLILLLIFLGSFWRRESRNNKNSEL